MQIPTGYELLADRLHSIAMQTEHDATAGRKLDRIEGRRPAFVMPPRRLLDFVAVGTDAVDRPGQHLEMFANRCVLDAVTVGEQHGSGMVCLCLVRKTSGTADIAFLPSTCIWSLLPNTGARVLNPSALACLRTHFARVCDQTESKLLACDGEDDHVHLLIEYPPKVSVDAMVNALKGTSSRLQRKERPDIAVRYWQGTLWAPSYFAGSAGGAAPAVLRNTWRCNAAPPRPERRGFRPGAPR